jgi:TatA/E family protein of Tat protein translocase
MFDLFQPTHLLFVLLVALLVFGPKGLVEMSRDLGRIIQNVQEYRQDFKEGLLSIPTKDELEKKHSGKKG